jgi:citrate synthase
MDKTSSTNGTSSKAFVPGLEGIVAAQTRLSHVDGEAGQLLIAGYPVDSLAPNATFEEVAYVLWHGMPPAPDQRAAFSRALAQQRILPAATLDLLRAAAARNVPVMDALRLAAGTLSLSGQAGSADLPAAAVPLLAQLPTIVAAYWRLRQGQAPVPPHPGLGHVANYVYMLFGEQQPSERVRGLETYLNTVIDHGLNASTFTARVIISTGSDLVSAVTGAIGALKGPLHGGAPGPALNMVFEIGDLSRAEAYLRAKLDRKERLMGFGHRIYKVRDPRADVLAAAAERLFRRDADRALYDLARGVEDVAVALLAERYPQHSFKTNVEFYTALLLHGLELPTELFSPTFAISRAAGWIAHCLEQQAANRIIRPQSEYVGERHAAWPAVAVQDQG